GTAARFGAHPDAARRAAIGPALARRLAVDGTVAESWGGEVEPLEDRFTLYLGIFRSSDGGLLAGFRNPERNSRGGAAQFRVRRDGDAVRFNARPDETRPEILVNGSPAGSPIPLPVHLRRPGARPPSRLR